MIDVKRPVYIVQLFYTQPDDLLKQMADPLRYHGNLTIDPGSPWARQEKWESTSCCANMVKKDEADKSWFCKCMEPAVFYVSLQNGFGGLGYGHYCEYHKPRVVAA